MKRPSDAEFEASIPDEVPMGDVHTLINGLMGEARRARASEKRLARIVSRYVALVDMYRGPANRDVDGLWVVAKHVEDIFKSNTEQARAALSEDVAEAGRGHGGETPVADVLRAFLAYPGIAEKVGTQLVEQARAALSEMEGA